MATAFGEAPADGVAAGQMAAWLRSISFDVPESHFWPTSFGLTDLDVNSGTCTNLTIGDLKASDLSSTGAPEVGYLVSGVSLQCVMLARGGALEIRFAIADLSLRLAIGFGSVSSSDGRYALPLGSVEVKDCELQLSLQGLQFKGTSMMASILGHMRQRIESFADSGMGPMFACTELKKMVSQRASQAASQLAGSLLPLLGVEHAKPQVLTQLPDSEVEDWGTYPPMQVVRALLHERPMVLSRLLAAAPPIELLIGMTLNSTSPPSLTTAASTQLLSALEEDPVKAQLRLGSAHIHGLQSVIGETLLLNGAGRRMDAKVAFEGVRVVVDGELEVTIEPPLGTAPRPLREDLNLTLHLSDVSVAAEAASEVSRPQLESLFVDQLQMPNCLASTAGGTGGHQPRVNVLDVAGVATPDLSCSASGGLERALSTAVQTTVQALLPLYTPAVRALVSGVLSASVPKVDMFLSQTLADMPPCAPTGVYQGPGSFMEQLLLVSGVGLVLFGLVAGTCGKPCLARARTEARRHRRQSHPLVQLGIPETRREDSMSSLASTMSFSSLDGGVCHGSSLANHAVVPKAVVVGFPIVTCAAFVLFVYADLCIATVIDFVFVAGGRTFTLGPALAFSVLIIAVDAWHAGAYCIAICIAALSITWPFVKLGLLLFAWLAPTDVMSSEARGRLLTLVDEYGKWSLIDTWLGILALACYRLGWKSSEESISFVVDPVPKMPFFVFVMAQVISLALGHVASGLHRRATEADAGGCDEEEDRIVSKPLYTFLPFGTAYRLTAGLLLTIVLIVMCVQLETFEMVESGALSDLLNDPDGTVSTYSLVDLGLGITYGKEGDVGLIMVQAIFFIFAVIIPLALPAAIVVLLLCPLRLGQHRFMMDLCKALDAWAAFDVFALAVLVSRFEFGLFSTFLMHYNNLELGCALVDQYLHTECFHMECRFTPGFTVLALAALASYLLPKYAFQVCEAAMEEARASKV